MTPPRRRLRRGMDGETDRGSTGVGGFHDDQYLVDVADALLREARYFVETGTNLGVTLRHCASRHSGVECFSCEPDPRARATAEALVGGLPNARVAPTASPAFIHDLFEQEPAILDSPTVFWLDAHGYGFDWPLRDEIAAVSRGCARAAVLIDDFLVPGRPEFGFDRYRGQTCSYDLIAPDIDSQRKCGVFYPAYRERTSPYHALRGWVLLDLGFDVVAAAGPSMRDTTWERGSVLLPPHATGGTPPS